VSIFAHIVNVSRNVKHANWKLYLVCSKCTRKFHYYQPSETYVRFILRLCVRFGLMFFSWRLHWYQNNVSIVCVYALFFFFRGVGRVGKRWESEGKGYRE